jgi:hypothetical protein
MRTLRLGSRRRLFAVILVIAILAALFLALLPKTRVDRELSAIRATGLPATPAELHQWYKAVPDQENGALVVSAAFELYQDDAALRKLTAQEAFSPAREASTRHYLETNKAAIRKLRELPSFKRSRFPSDFSAGPAAKLPHLGQIQKLTFLSKVDAIDRAAQGNPGEAIAALQSSFALARTLAREPVLISQLVRLGSIYAAIEGLQSLLNQHPLSRQALLEFADLLNAAEQDSYLALHCAYVGERVNSMEMLQLTYSDLGKFSQPESSGEWSVAFKRALNFRFRTVTGRKQDDLLQLLHAMQR